MCTGVKAGKGVLSPEDPYQNDVSFSCADAPTGISGVIQKLGEHKTTRLTFGCGDENGNDHGDGSNRMPPNGNAVDVSEEVNSKSVDQAFIMSDEYMPNDQRLNPLEHTLADQEGSIHSDYRLLVWDKTGVNRSSSGDEGRTSKTMGTCRCVSPQRFSKRTNLIPAVTATWPRRLNQPQIHEMKGAFLGVESIAAQKYGPPLVGWALQISERSWQRFGNRAAIEPQTCHGQTNGHRENCVTSWIASLAWRGERHLRTGNDQETPNHNHRTSGVLWENINKSQATRDTRDAYQTVEEHRSHTSSDADDRERNAEVLKDRS